MLNYTNTIEEIVKSGVKTAIIPMGSVEQHSTHLPIGTDCIIAEAAARRIGENMGAFVLPVIPIGTCYEHKCEGRFSAVWMRPTTLYSVIEDVVLSLKSQGFNRVVLLLGHGGLFIAAPAVRALNANNSDLTVVLYELFLSADKYDFMECGNDLHAGEAETSLILYLHEEYVKKDKMAENDFIPDVPRSFLNYASLLKLSKTGVWGKPSLATAKKGEMLFNAEVNTCTEFLKTAFDVAQSSSW